MDDVARLGPEDLSALRELNALFAAAFDDPETYAASPPGDAYVRRLLAADGNVVLVARGGGAVVGGLVAYRLDKFEQARSELYIFDLAVAEPYRRRGIATRLIGKLQAIAVEIGAWVVYVQADYGDAPAVALYTKLGVRQDVMHFDLPVIPPPSRT